MLLKNLMEDKQLNLNKPFLSVRRIRPAVAFGRDEMKKPGHSLPTVTHPLYKSELKSGPVSNPGAVPFLWEQSPGRPKDESMPQIHVTEKKPHIAPRLPPGRRLKENQDFDKAHETQMGSKRHTEDVEHCMNLDDNVKKIEGIDCSEEMIQDKEKNESEDGDEVVYMDALDKLSRTESFFLNCSVSGLSELDETEVKPSGTYLTDPQARDFMIGRFLPAAKAMASEKTLETPHYVARKQHAVQEQPRQLKKVVNGDKRPQLRYGHSFALKYSQSHDNGEEESDDDSSEDVILPYKVCGLLPHFCMKSSICLMNPVPGMSARTRVPMSPASRTRTESSSTTSCSGSENEVSKSESAAGFLTAYAYVDKNDLKGREISVHANDPSENYVNKAIPGLTGGGNNTEGMQKDTGRSIKELLANHNDAKEADLAASQTEKTLHVDTIYKVESQIMESCSPTMERPSNLHDEDHELHKKITGQNPLLDSSLGYFAKPAESIASKPNIGQPASAEKSSNGRGMMKLMASGPAQNRYQEEVTPVKPNNDVKQITRKQTVTLSEHLAPPPLPKSPSDSWLCRTLPSISAKNASLRSYVGTAGPSPKNQSCKTPSSDPKWETIVKSTKGHQQHLRYSEELMDLNPIPEAQ